MEEPQVVRAFRATIGHGLWSERGFSEGVGLHHFVAERLFAQLRGHHPDLHDPKALLSALNFLKEYRAESIASLPFDILSHQTYEAMVWSVLDALDSSLPPVLAVSIPPFRAVILFSWSSSEGLKLRGLQALLLPPSLRSTAPSALAYGPKMKNIGPLFMVRDIPFPHLDQASGGREKETGFRYLVLTRTTDGLILGYYGPYGGASNDLTLLHHYQVTSLLNPGEMYLADGLFRCSNDYLNF